LVETCQQEAHCPDADDDDCGDGAACYEDTTEEPYFGGIIGVCRERCH